MFGASITIGLENVSLAQLDKKSHRGDCRETKRQKRFRLQINTVYTVNTVNAVNTVNTVGWSLDRVALGS